MSRIGDAVGIKLHASFHFSLVAIDSDPQKSVFFSLTSTVRLRYSRDQACALSRELVDSGVDDNEIGAGIFLCACLRALSQRLYTAQRANEGKGLLLSFFEAERSDPNNGQGGQSHGFTRRQGGESVAVILSRQDGNTENQGHWVELVWLVGWSWKPGLFCSG